MRRKLLSFILILFMFMSLLPSNVIQVSASTDEGTEVIVYNEDELHNAIKTPNFNIKLGANIELESNDDSGTLIIDENGTIDGNEFYIKCSSAIELKNSCLNLKNVTIYEGIQNSGIYIYSGSKAVLNDCTFIGNVSTVGGAILIGENGEAFLNNCKFIENKAGSGGAIYIDKGGKAVLNYCTFDNNTAYNGGAIFIESYDIYNGNKGGTIIIDSCTAIGNKAEQNGGAIYVNFGGEAEVYNCILKDNEANAGGAIFINNNGDGNRPGTLIMDACTVIENRTTEYGGGGIFNKGNLYINNSTIANNYSNEIGGGIQNYNLAKLYVMEIVLLY